MNDTIPNYLLKQEFIAFDTETTGIWAPSNRVVEIAAIKFRLGQDSTERFESFINPERKMSPKVIKIHGITDDMVAEAPSASDVWPRFVEFCGPNSIWIAHNAPFDISFVGCELGREEISLPDNPCLDSIDLYQRFHPGLGSYSLLNLIRHFGLGQTQDHRALSDAEYVLRLINNIMPQLSKFNSRRQLLNRTKSIYLKDWDADKPIFPDGMADLEKAVQAGKRVKIKYRGGGQPLMERIIQPRNTYALGSKTYIIAFCEGVKAERTFRLDRIEGYSLEVEPISGQ